VLPFGISTAGYIFTKVLRVLVKRWREQGIPVVMFLDDGISGARDYIYSKLYSRMVKLDLEDFGRGQVSVGTHPRCRVVGVCVVYAVWCD
jgi:hypothetical protein